uniref:Rhotekin n=1 Tax=Nothoprocta perdicaria TaxID=30464 RepID=A0A8C6YL61_NOTPE
MVPPVPLNSEGGPALPAPLDLRCQGRVRVPSVPRCRGVQVSLYSGDTDIQKKIDHEIRMREGACKLLAACTQREQALEATKSLLVCNSRILAYMSELQRMKEVQVMQRVARRPSDAGPADERLPCRGTVCVSDLRIPLMWKDTEYFKNKGGEWGGGQRGVTHTLLAESRADVQRWMEAFWQHFYDMSQWKQCCEELMRIEVPSPRRPPAPLPKQGSLYHEMGERGHGVGHGDRDGARSVALLSALPLAPLRDAASLSASSCSLCHSGSAPLRLQRCPAPPGRPPPARGSCCRITPSRRRSALCSPPITVTGDVAGPPGCPHHGPRPLASATSRSRSVQAPPGSGNVPAAAPIPAVRRIPTLGMSQLQDMSRPGLDAAPGHILSPGLSPRERRPGQGGVPALELSWPRSG